MSSLTFFTGSGRREGSGEVLGSLSHLSQHRRGTEPEQTHHSLGRAWGLSGWEHTGTHPNSLGGSCPATGSWEQGQSWAGTHSVPQLSLRGHRAPWARGLGCGTRSSPWTQGCACMEHPEHIQDPAVSTDPCPCQDCRALHSSALLRLGEVQ